MRRKAKGRIVGEPPVAVRALEPQHPGAKNTHVLLDHEAKGASPTLMEPEDPSGGTMGTCLGVARLPSRFDLLRVVLNFLFGCHNLNCATSNGGRAAIGNDSVRPFSFPQIHGTQTSTARQHGGRGPILRNSGGGVKKAGFGGPGGGVTTSINARPTPRSRLTQCEAQQRGNRYGFGFTSCGS